LITMEQGNCRGTRSTRMVDNRRDVRSSTFRLGDALAAGENALFRGRVESKEGSLTLDGTLGRGVTLYSTETWKAPIHKRVHTMDMAEVREGREQVEYITLPTCDTPYRTSK